MVTRTQEERSTAMRRRLLDATVECLVEYGYAGTTTPRVAERAGVTRGAQVHHFPTKADLVTAAVRHLATERVEFAAGETDRLKASADALGAGLDLLWGIHRGRLFVATVELWMAARSDPELRDQLKEVEPLVTGALAEFVRGQFPAQAARPAFRHWLYTAMDVIRGILVSEVAMTDDRLDQRWRRARGHLLLLAAGLGLEGGSVSGHDQKLTDTTDKN
ncbi:TetR/AcrR family transcriptional regulator [Amycolatopsis sp. H20-H5]|uniref:TetR/AcrR family transcriptional regulator n=1 Tax=Amycolatopsis sp. H20-H5 TaxID=3046309 RepID=UPI002DBF9254|nr:TetR/AcrR family transcriptional regulator [Amycolatopsis sp. H20-H5]MEC3978488.1 TetR/AcrR family transcriptional regulator [Amycolatopsis sp. H20-H5]